MAGIRRARTPSYVHPHRDAVKKVGSRPRIFIPVVTNHRKPPARKKKKNCKGKPFIITLVETGNRERPIEADKCANAADIESDLSLYNQFFWECLAGKYRHKTKQKGDFLSFIFYIL